VSEIAYSLMVLNLKAISGAA